jgi:plastocyanin
MRLAFLTLLASIAIAACSDSAAGPDTPPDVLAPAPAHVASAAKALSGRADRPTVLAGDSTALRATVAAQGGRRPGRDVTWRSLDGGTVVRGVVDSQSVMMFTASEPGSYRLVAESPSLSTSDTTLVIMAGASVTSTITSLVMKPARTSIQPDDTLRFAVWGLTSSGDSVPAPVSLHPDRGYARGLDFYCSIEGTFEVRAILDGSSISASAEVTVSNTASGSSSGTSSGTSGSIVRLQMTPDRITIPPGDTLEFQLQGVTSTGGRVPVSGHLRADRGYVVGLKWIMPIEGTFRIRAFNDIGTMADTTWITVKAGAPHYDGGSSTDIPSGGGTSTGTLSKIVMSPVRDTIPPGDTLRFQVKGITTTGATVPVNAYLRADRGYVVGLKWIMPVEGTFRIRAFQEDGTLADTAWITVKSGAPSSGGTQDDGGSEPVDGTGNVTQPPPSSVPTGGVAELPRALPDVRYVAPTGRVINVPSGGDLQAAINNAVRGDVIQLAAGARFVGNYKLPAKSGSGWITIRTATTLPAEGTRVTPSSASSFAKIITPNSMPAIWTETSGSTSYYRIMGVELTSSASMTYAIVNLGAYNGAASSPSNLPTQIVLDRTYIHGTSSMNLQRCVTLNSRSSAVLDSWLSDCHYHNTDTQAIGGWTGTGPYLIQNNHLEAAGENIMFGGADPAFSGVVPSDITIRHNHIYKPLSWKGVWVAKNLLELKTAQRVLIEDNVLENNWADGQTGFAFVMKSVNQGGGCSWCVVQDITIRHNLLINSPGGFNLASSETEHGGTVIGANSITITQNLFQNVAQSTMTGSRILFQLTGGVSSVTITHNTAFSDDKSVLFDGAPTPHLVMENNLWTRGRYGIFGSGHSEGSSALAYYAPDGSIRGNIIVGAPSSEYPSYNFYPGTLSLAGLLNIVSDLFEVGSSSPYYNKGTDGASPGVDVDWLMNRVAGVK